MKPAPPLKLLCPTCGKPKDYFERYDAYGCISCGVWLESQCKDPNCEYCVGRPEKPMEEQIEDGDENT